MQQENSSQPPQHRLQHQRTSVTSIKSSKQSQHQRRRGSLKCWHLKTAPCTCNHSPEEVRYANTDIRDVLIRPILVISRLPPDDTPIMMCCVRHYLDARRFRDNIIYMHAICRQDTLGLASADVTMLCAVDGLRGARNIVSSLPFKVASKGHTSVR